MTYSSSTYLKYRFIPLRTSLTLLRNSPSHHVMKRAAISPAAFTPMAPPLACFLISSLNLKMWFFSMVLMATPRAIETIFFISSSPGVCSGFLQHSHLSFSFSFMPHPVIVGFLPDLFLLAQCFPIPASSSSFSLMVSDRYSPSSSVFTFLKLTWLFWIISTHFSVAKSISIDGYSAFTSMLPIMHLSRFTVSLTTFTLLSMSSVLVHGCFACWITGCRIDETKWESL